eukprot:jgi/Mesvir1/129/Mv07792-RA.2
MDPKGARKSNLGSEARRDVGRGGDGRDYRRGEYSDRNRDDRRDRKGEKDRVRFREDERVAYPGDRDRHRGDSDRETYRYRGKQGDRGGRDYDRRDGSAGQPLSYGRRSASDGDGMTSGGDRGSDDDLGASNSQGRARHRSRGGSRQDASPADSGDSRSGDDAGPAEYDRGGDADAEPAAPGQKRSRYSPVAWDDAPRSSGALPRSTSHRDYDSGRQSKGRRDADGRGSRSRSGSASGNDSGSGSRKRRRGARDPSGGARRGRDIRDSSSSSGSDEDNDYVDGVVGWRQQELEQEKEEQAARQQEGGGKGALPRRKSWRGTESDYERELNARERADIENDDSDDELVGRPPALSDEEDDDEDDDDGGGGKDTSGDDRPEDPRRHISMLQSCRHVDEYERLNRIDEGTYGVVYRARNKATGEIVALKKVKMEKEKEGFPQTALREINILLSFHHPCIVDVKEVVVGKSLDSIFMVMEFMDHDVKSLMGEMSQRFSTSEVKCLMQQLLEGVAFLHEHWVLHRDLKTSNLLFNHKGELKICDFGLARQYGSPLKPYTHMVVTLWYRAPELLLGTKTYSTAIDMWSVGCIFAELLAKEPLFQGKRELDQIDQIFKMLGTPNDKIWPGFAELSRKANFTQHPYSHLRDKFPATSFAGKPTLSDAGFDLLNRLLTYDPTKRISAAEALQHSWFREQPPPKEKELMPTYPTRKMTGERWGRLPRRLESSIG